MSSGDFYGITICVKRKFNSTLLFVTSWCIIITEIVLVRSKNEGRKCKSNGKRPNVQLRNVCPNFAVVSVLSLFPWSVVSAMFNGEGFKESIRKFVNLSKNA